jgi:adenosylmethionine---8-amino-7-oxononanoate aminotransferase
MANPLACAAADASLDIFAETDRLGQARAIEAVLADALEPCRAWPGIVDVRTKGAIGVVQLQALGDAAWLRQLFIERGVWARPFGDILYVTPPLSIETGDLSTLATALRSVARDWSARFGGAAERSAGVSATDL